MTTSSRNLPSLVAGGATAIVLLALAAAVLAALASLATDGLPGLTTRDWAIIRRTTLQATLSTVLSLALGTLVAWALAHRARFRGRSLIIAVLGAALVMPTLSVVLALVAVWGRAGWAAHLLAALGLPGPGGGLYGLAGIVTAHVWFNGALVARGVLNRLEAVDAARRRLSRGLSLTAWHRFRALEWPAVVTALRPLAATVFLLCFTSFAIVLTLGGSPRNNTLEVAIYEAVKLDFDMARALTLALTQLAVCAAIIVLAGRRGGEGRAGGGERWTCDRGVAGWMQRGVLAFAILFFLLPLAALVADGASHQAPRVLLEPAFAHALAMSLAIATASAALTVAATLALAFGLRTLELPSRLARRGAAGFAAGAMRFAATLYLAMPALVMGLGLFVLARTTIGVNDASRWGALVAANTLLALPFALAVLAPAASRLAARHDRLASSLGLGGGPRLRLVDLPLLRADLALVAAIAFCLSFGDLGVIALFGSQDFATLPWLLYQKFGSYRTDDAAVIALALFAVVMTVFAGLPRLLGGRDAAAG